MKKTLSAFLIFLSITAYSQTQPINTITWISGSLGGLRFYGDQVNFNFGNYESFKKYYLTKDTLVMIDDYTTSADNFKDRHVDLFKFLIIQSDAQSLTLIPVNANAKKIADTPSYNFKDIKHIEDRGIKFTRLHLKAGPCYGTCPILDVDIDNKGVYYLKGEKYTEPYNGYFKGKLNADQLDSLNYFIQHSEVEKLQGWKQKMVVMDTPPYYLTIYYNRKKLKVQTNYPPMNISDLINFILQSYKKVALLPDPEKREFDEGPYEPF
ncbi:MAG: hypothetical protein JWR50_2029 [Mucilaginibacter sp.]|nr:hypothetical protein [Mucilaginibacter sp.]